MPHRSRLTMASEFDRSAGGIAFEIKEKKERGKKEGGKADRQLSTRRVTWHRSRGCNCCHGLRP